MAIDMDEKDVRKHSVLEKSPANAEAQSQASTSSIAIEPPDYRLAQQSTPPKDGISSWILEILGCIVAAILFIIMVVVLSVSNHKSISDLPWTIELGSVLSVLVLFLETAAAITLASCMCQSVWGSFQKRSSRQTEKRESLVTGPGSQRHKNGVRRRKAG